MSFKSLFFIIIILLLGTFLYLKYEAAGDPDSGFNQTTRYDLGQHPFLRTIIGLHNTGDARGEYLGNPSPLVIEWLEPQTDNVDTTTIQSFADLVGKYTGRQTQVFFGGAVSTGTVQLQDLNNLVFRSLQKPSGDSVLYLVFADDYQPRAQQEQFTTYEESTIVLSLNANQQFTQNYPQYSDNYLLAGMLRGFGKQIGLSADTDPSCVMDSTVGVNGQPFEAVGQSVPQDFCPAEQSQIQNLKLKY